MKGGDLRLARRLAEILGRDIGARHLQGTGLLSIAAIVVALLRWDGLGSLCVVLGGAAYVLGSILVTMRGNVPLNNAVMRVTQADALGEATWRGHVRDWTRWNHVRTIACFVAMALFILALEQ